MHEGAWKWGGRSVCVGCARTLVWYENIPLVSFVWLKGRCRTCKIIIPKDYFLVELATPLLLVGLTYFHLNIITFNPWHYFRDFLFAVILIIVFVYDFKYKLILSGLTWAGVILALVINHHLGMSIEGLALGAAVGGGFFLLQYLVSRGRWVGGGDARLGCMIGALLGWPNIVVALFFSYIMGALVAVPLLVARKKNMNSEMPFGTFLAVGTFVTLLWGSAIVGWYLRLVGWN